MKGIQDDLLFQMPDLIFVRLCEEEYGINRGIYNTVDQWFYEQGVSEIVERRKIILDFFRSLKLNEDRDGKMKFGSKGLTEGLVHFFEKSNHYLICSYYKRRYEKC